MLVVVCLADDGRLALKSRYDPGSRGCDQTAMPSLVSDRTWDGDAKTWYVAPDWGEGLIEILRDLGGMTVTDMRPPPPPTTADLRCS